MHDLYPRVEALASESEDPFVRETAAWARRHWTTTEAPEGSVE
jgi:hypothetical protein